MHSKLTEGILAECEVDLRQLPVYQEDLLSTSVNIPCGQEAFCQLLSNFCAARNLSSTYVKFLSGQETFCQLPLTFRAAG